MGGGGYNRKRLWETGKAAIGKKERVRKWHQYKEESFKKRKERMHFLFPAIIVGLSKNKKY